MNLLVETKKLCQKYFIYPKRQRGQNFLIDEKVLNKIIKVSEISKKDVVLEIGAGLGTLTKKIIDKAKKVIAIEIDKSLVNVLKNELKDCKNVKIIQKDVRKIDILQELGVKKYKIVANLPYNITGLVLKKFLSEKYKPELIILMLQKEVAERIIANPPKMSILSISVQFYGIPQIIMNVSKKSSWPEPKVDSAILKIILKNKYKISEDKFFKLIRAGFSSKRKYLLNNLAKNDIMNKDTGKQIFKKLNIGEKIRAQELSIDNWIKLFRMSNI